MEFKYSELRESVTEQQVEDLANLADVLIDTDGRTVNEVLEITLRYLGLPFGNVNPNG